MGRLAVFVGIAVAAVMCCVLIGVSFARGYDGIPDNDGDGKRHRSKTAVKGWRSQGAKCNELLYP